MSTPKPVFLLAGGPGGRGKGPDPLMTEVFASSGVASPTVAYLGSASNDDRKFFGWISPLLSQAGAGSVMLVPTVRHFERAKAERLLQDADCIFFSGGDVEQGIHVIKKCGLMELLASLYRKGTQFFGASAGSIMLARQWVRWEDENDDSSARPFDCLGIAPVFCDTHDEGSGWEELRALLPLLKVPATGYGIATGTMLRVSPAGDVLALGGRVARFAVQQGATVQLPDLEPEDF
jgi:Peptidase family S51